MENKVVFLIDKGQIKEVVDLIIMDRNYYHPDESFLDDERERYMITESIEQMITSMNDGSGIRSRSSYGATVTSMEVNYGSTKLIIIDVLFNPKMFDRNLERYYYDETEKELVKSQ